MTQETAFGPLESKPNILNKGQYFTAQTHNRLTDLKVTKSITILREA